MISGLTAIPIAERDTAYYHSTPTPVPIFQREWEWATLLGLYRQRQPRRVLEIGTYHGGTLFHWLKLAALGTTVVSVDSYAVQGVDNRAEYPGWTPRGVTLAALAGDSRNPGVIQQVESYGPFDWIAIDAGHFEDEVQADWDHYAPMCAPGGIIALHDIQPSPHDWLKVDRVWAKIRQSGELTQEIVCDASLDWGGWGVVYR